MPRPGEKRAALRATPPAERSLRDGHPWLYGTSLLEGPESCVPGDFGVVFDRKRRFLGIGLLDPEGSIRLRVLHANTPTRIDAAWYLERLKTAFAKRATLAASGHTDGYRLVNGESDGFPGLVLDRYADTLVLKLYTAAWIPQLPDILPHLAGLQPHVRLVLRLNRSMRRIPEHLHGLADGQILSGQSLEGPVVFRENGLRFEAAPIDGQKTGFFLDQRDNRSKVETLARNRDVLNVFSYTGGFSVYAARGGARSVTSVDISREAMEGAERNFRLNRAEEAVDACPHHVIAKDAFDALADLAKCEMTYGMVILDPPMFAQSSAQVDQALRAYRRLTQMGLAVLAKGGILVQASCSNRVPAEDFFRGIEETAKELRRPMHDVVCTGHAIDHPDSFPEGSYLKCLFARVS